jgi:EAL domain-containing protein (putative c-di-GMP-specific phosphodiesterase class I)/NO-binding membrane sensor protein with MHYT domain
MIVPTMPEPQTLPEATWLIPALQPSILLFLVFSTLVVHVCQRLVEQMVLVIDPTERRIDYIRTSVCIGCLVWALDAAGMFLYPAYAAQSADMLRVVAALGIMVSGACLTIPALSSTRDSWRITAAALGLAIGMIAAHMVLMSALKQNLVAIRWTAFAASILVASGLACVLALRHRKAQLSSIGTRFHALSWTDKVIAGVTILPLHFFLVNTIPGIPTPSHTPMGGLPMLLALVLFGIALSADQMFLLLQGKRRQFLVNRALAMVRHVNPHIDKNQEHRLALVAERLPYLLSTEFMKIYFQPICPIASPEEGVRFEALLRVTSPDLGTIHPELFFLACERVSMTIQADREVLAAALECSRPWIRPDIRCSGISVNVAPGTLLDHGFVSWLESQLENWPWEWLQLEITEHAFISSSDQLIQILDQLREIGVPVVLDDFGSGFSSLTVLADLPIHGIKCDRAFVKDILLDSTRQTLLRHICGLGRGLDLSVTVEGVETRSELAIVKNCGVGCIQGYVFSRPMPTNNVGPWMESMSPRQFEETTSLQVS